MRIKKSMGNIYGMDLTASERKAMELEIQRQLAEYDDTHIREFDAMILWVLHTQYGFGHDRLKKFYKEFNSQIDALLDRYLMENKDSLWLCTYKLKEYGVDLEAWDAEYKQKC